MSASEQVTALYRQLLEAWNARDAAAMAALCATEGLMVGFDGSIHSGPDAIRDQVGHIFADHQTAEYVAKVQAVRLPRPGVAVLYAYAGMAPRGATQLNEATNAVQTMVATLQEDGAWRIVLFQNTPAAFHGRPELSAAMTRELTEIRGRGAIVERSG